MNLIETILKLVCSGDLLGRISSLLGIGQDQAGKAVNAAVPSLLAGLIGSASRPEGATQLSNVLARQDPGLLSNLSGLFSQGANTGIGNSNPLSALLGGSVLGQMSGVLSNFTGLGESSVSKLLGMLAPVVLGVIGKHASGLDAGGLASMLAGQKANVTAALPSGLGGLLSSAVPSLGNILGGASRAASAAYSATAHATADAARQTQAAGSSAMRWLIPIILIVLALIFLPRLWRKAPDMTTEVKTGVENAATAVTDSSKFVSGVSDAIKNAGKTLADIKDEASASAALPKLQDINTKLADLKSLWGKLPASVQKAAGDSLRPLVAKLRDAVQPVVSLPMVGDKIKPTVDQMLGTLDSFTASP